MGSVKDLFVLSSPRDDIMGQGKFVFSDRYSVFDWGEMPDHIAGKGQSLCLIGAYFFEKLEELGYQTHYLGLEENGQWKKLQDLQAPSNVMGVKLVRVIHPTQMGETYDYGVYHRENNNFLIPFEFIYRNSLPAGSSFRRRVGDKTIRLDDYGLKSLPPDDEILTSPILDVSTKLEEQDRYLSWKDVLMVGILNEDDVDAIQLALRFANDLISREVASIGLRNEDGKIELAFNPHQELIFVDVVGTPDECRFTTRGIHLSKEIAREFYRKTEWYEEVKSVKSTHQVGWKYLVKSQPISLPKDLLRAITWMYQRIAMDLTRREWFSRVPSFPQVVEEIAQFV